MTFKEWFSDERYKELLKEVSRYVPPEDAADVLHEIMLQLLETDKLCDDYKAYIVRSAYMSYNSTTSPYARKYARNVTEVELDGREDTIPDETDELSTVDIFKLIEETPDISWWEREALKRKILEEKTFKEVADEWCVTQDQAVYSYYKAINKIKQFHKLNDMTKKKSKPEDEVSDNKLFTDNEFEVVAVEDAPTVAEVSIEYEVNPEKPNTEESLMKAKIEVSPEPEKPKDPKIAILEAFASIMRTHGKHGLVKMEIGEELWGLWQKYTGRTDKWRKCGSCLVPKVHKMIDECKRFGILVR